MAELFQKSRSTINEHIINIFNQKELDSESVVRKIGISDFSTKPTNYYNREYIIKGFTLDDQRLKNGGNINYFKELLERIRDIRSKEIEYAEIDEKVISDFYSTYEYLNNITTKLYEFELAERRPQK